MEECKIKEREFVFLSGGNKLIGRLFEPEIIEKDILLPSIIILHGWMLDNQESSFKFAREISRKGFICMTFNYRGHSGSEGILQEATRRDFFVDAINGYDFLTHQEHVDTNSITVIGSSLGGYLAILLSEERKVRSLILKVPANAPDKFFDQKGTMYQSSEDIMSWRKTVHHHSESKSLRALHNFTGSILLFYAGQDEALPHEVMNSYIKAVADVKQLTYVMFGQATHIMYKNPGIDRQILNISVEWLMTIYK